MILERKVILKSYGTFDRAREIFQINMKRAIKRKSFDFFFSINVNELFFKYGV